MGIIDPDIFNRDSGLPETGPNQLQTAASRIWGHVLNEWKELMDKRPPKDSLSRKLIAKRGKTPPLYRYGFPFTRQYALDYARRHHLKLKLVDEDIEAFGGREELDLADIDDSWLQDRERWLFAMGLSRNLMVADLSRRCGFSLDSGRPFALEWDGIISLWSNYNVEERWIACADYDHVLAVLGEAMNEVDGHNSKVQWWFDWNNDLDAI